MANKSRVNPRTAFEDVLAAERVASRAAGYGGWEPPESPEDITPYDLWERAVRLFPHALQRAFDDPKVDEDRRGSEITVEITGEIPLSEDSGISLSARRHVSQDADEEGPSVYRSEGVAYTLWVDRKMWGGSSLNLLRAHLHQFESVLKERDPVGYNNFAAK